MKLKLEIYIGDEKLDLFDDENIVLNKTIKNYNNIDKIFSDYTQTFTIPASKQNNKVMNYWYDSDVTQTFNPSTKKTARIDINKNFFKTGFVKFDAAQLKNGKVENYSITFFTALTNLKQIFSNDTLTDLNIVETLPYTDFESAIDSRLQSNAVLIPMISSERNWTMGSLPDKNTINYNSFSIQDAENKYLKFSTFTDPANNLDTIENKIRVKDTAPSNPVSIFLFVIVADQAAEFSVQILDAANDYNNEYNSATFTGNTLINAPIVRPLFGQKQLVIDFNNIDKVEFFIKGWAILNEGDTTIFNFDYPANGALLYEFKPALALTSIISAIETKYSLTFSNDFFNTPAFTELYTWTNREKGVGNHFESDYVQFTNADTIIDINGIWSAANNRLEITSVDGETINKITTQAVPLVSILKETNVPKPTITLVAKLYNTASDTTTYTESVLTEKNNYANNFEFSRPVSGTDQITFYVKSTFPEKFKWTLISDQSYLNFGIVKNSTEFDNDSSCVFHFSDYAYNDSLTGESKIVNGGLPNQKITDFFAGIIKMFNLVIIPDDTNSNSFQITTLNDWYATGSDVNLTRYVNLESEQVNTISLFGEIDFKYDPTKQIIGENFRENNFDVGYGDLRTSLVDSYGDTLSGGSLEVKVPFTNPSWQRLIDQASPSSDAPFLSQLLVLPMVDKDIKATNDKTFFFYYAGQKDMNDESYFGVRKFYSDIQTVSNRYDTYNLCYQYNTGNDSFTKCLNFGSEINPFTLNDGNASTPSLYNDYWEDYISDLYSTSMRETIVKAILPLGIILTLKLNDTIIIRAKKYKINDMKINLITGETNFKLLTLVV